MYANRNAGSRAHSSDGNPSLATAEKIQFTNQTGYSDTFFYYGDIEVTATPQTHNVTLKRATAMVRFVINDAMPANVTTLRFYYTGGSGALNAKTGLGCVASKQTVTTIAMPAEGAPYIYELYTIPREQTANLSLTVTAYASGDMIVKERVFKDVTVEQNKITEFKGSFFTDTQTEEPGTDTPQQTQQETFAVNVDTAWDGTITKSY